MKLTLAQMERGAARREAEARRQLTERFADHPEADFLNLGSGRHSVGMLVERLNDRGIHDEAVIDRLIASLLDGSLHRLQVVRISRLLNDPDEDLEPEDRELLIAQVLDLEWPKAFGRPN
ncbi:hypothetical protein [Jannaschia sp. LMIT008]|uniref:hypothetical protein n=1 Tax=Jannaschia maritima TaxID=3032585 RepID=UPI0028126B76|nr:hypothetical protein [Jannaschia sp. LMIT008]